MPNNDYVRKLKKKVIIKRLFDDNVKTTCASSDLEKTDAKFQKYQAEIVGVAPTVYPLIASMDRQTDRRTHLHIRLRQTMGDKKGFQSLFCHL